MATDALNQLQTSTTSTSTTSGTPLTLPTGSPRYDVLACRFLYSAASNASGSNNIVFSLDVSRDGGSTFDTEFQAPPIALSTSAKAGELLIPFSVTPTNTNGCQIKATATFSGSGVSPTITWQAALQIN